MLWFNFYNELKAFKKKNRHMCVKYADDGIFQWCQRQRREFRKEILSAERIKLLNKIKFDFNPAISRRYAVLSEMEVFYKKHGHTNFKRGTELQLFNAAIAFRNTKSDLPSDMLKSLKAIKFK